MHPEQQHETDEGAARAEGIDRGVHGVFDGVGKDTFDMDFDLLRRCVLRARSPVLSHRARD